MLNKKVIRIIAIVMAALLLKKTIEKSNKTIEELWPNLEVYFHGGVSFSPYRSQFEFILPKKT